jgi:mycothione reductase
MGTKVTILEMADRLVLAEEPEIAALLQKQLSKRMKVYTGTQVEEVKPGKEGVIAITRNSKTGRRRQFAAESIMVAVGRRSNADILRVGESGVELDNRGFIKVNEHLETSQKNIFAVGDANGQQMFTHMANRGAAIVAHNALHGTSLKVDYAVVPHAVYSHPQIASVGLSEENARKKHDILVSRTKYFDVAKGEAMMEKEGFAKAIVEKGSEKILGFHIIGPYAPELIQEVVNAMSSGGNLNELNQGIHIHPALSELVPTTVNSLEEP